MKLRVFAAATLALFVGASTAVVPFVNAATVEIVDTTYCRITFTQQDFNELRRSITDTDKGSLIRLKAEFPDLGGDLDLLIQEIETLLVQTQKFLAYSLTPAAHRIYTAYVHHDKNVGKSHQEILAMLFAPIIPALLLRALDDQEDDLVDSFHVTKPLAQRWIDYAESLPEGFGFDFDNGTYRGETLGPTALNILEPSQAVFDEFATQYTQSFGDCIAGKDSAGGDGGGENGTKGGSSFGSS